jgi:hypothetical protein
MRRLLNALMSTFGVSVLVVSVAGALPQPTASSGLLYLGTRDGVTVIDAATGSTTLSAHDALSTGDWSRVVRARRAGNRATLVEALDPASGTVLRSQHFDARLDVRAVSRDGGLVALMPSEPGRYGGNGLYRPASRNTTRIVLTRVDGAPERTIDLDANVEPEAFSTDDTALFVIKYSPPLHPDRYRVTRLDLATGELGDVFTNEKELQGNMRGIAYSQVLSPDGTKLYTFYKKQDGEAFVHALSLDQQVANCIDLPEGFGEDPDAVAITTTPNGAYVVVVDGAARKVSELDAAELRVEHTRSFRGLPATHDRVVAAATAGHVFVSTNHLVVDLSRATLRPLDHWSAEGRVQALELGGSGLLYVAERNRVTAIDPQDRGRGWALHVDGGGIRTVSDSLPTTGKGYVQCAC